MTATRKAAAPVLPVRDNRYYGRHADLPDPRDYQFRQVHRALLDSPLPSSVDMRLVPKRLPPVWDQLQLGSCVGNGVAAAAEAEQRRQGRAVYRPSRLALYYWARAIEGSTASDSGCEIRDGIKALAAMGAPHETRWPYKISRFAVKPTPAVVRDGALHQALQYARVENTRPLDMQFALAGGLPIVFGITVFESFESAAVAQSGVVPMPARGEAVLGGHCMLAVGYREEAAGVEYIVRNSWGAGWGDAGYCYMPALYLGNPDMASDFWVVSEVE